MFLPEGLAPAFPLAALLIRLGLLLGVNLIGLQNGLIQGLAAGLILAKLRIGCQWMMVRYGSAISSAET